MNEPQYTILEKIIDEELPGDALADVRRKLLERITKAAVSVPFSRMTDKPQR
jgi:hypothetical protein